MVPSISSLRRRGLEDQELKETSETYEFEASLSYQPLRGIRRADSQCQHLAQACV